MYGRGTLSRTVSLFKYYCVTVYSGVRMKMEMGTTQSQVVDIVTLRKLLEIMRLDSMPVLLKVGRYKNIYNHSNDEPMVSYTITRS